MEIKTRRYWIHFSKYFFIIILLNLALYWAAKGVTQNTNKMMIYNWLSIFKIVFVSISMIYFYYGETPLKTREKFVPIFILFLIDFTIIFLINYFNLFDRIITLEDIYIGIENYVSVYSFIFGLCLIFSIFISSKIIK